MEVDNTFIRSLNAFEEKIVVTVIELEFVSQTSIIFCFLFFFFLTVQGDFLSYRLSN